MIEWLLLAVGILGFGACGWLDLKATEFPDWIPYAMIVAALAIRGGFSLWTGDFSLIINSVTWGVGFLAFGLGLYLLRQWGDGDAWLLGALGFLYPDAIGFVYTGTLFFPLMLLVNFFIVAFVYLLAYTIGVGAVSGQTSKVYYKQFRGEIGNIVKITIGFAILTLVVGVLSFTGSLAFIGMTQMATSMYYLLALFPAVVFALLLFVSYGQFVEKKLFRKRIHVSKLREGDVPVGEKWRVLKKAEVRKLKKKGGHIWIKEGVRFAPVFVITVIVTYFLGNLFSFIPVFPL